MRDVRRANIRACKYAGVRTAWAARLSLIAHKWAPTFSDPSHFRLPREQPEQVGDAVDVMAEQRTHDAASSALGAPGARVTMVG
jgi:hypothetical protein